MKVLLDTNVLIRALPSRSHLHPIITSFVAERYSLVLTTEIFLEYEEIINEKANHLVASNILYAILQATNVVSVTVYFRWNLVHADGDDNKFSDAYLATGADYLVTTDGHFEPVKKAAYPKINVITPEEFLEILKKFS